MNKKLSNNSYIQFINGYLDSLCDIDGEQREFSASFSMIQSDKISLESEFKSAFEFMEDIEIIQDIVYKNSYGITYFLEKLLLVKPFKGLYETSSDVYIPQEVVQTYRDYIIFHLQDFFDFAFEEVEEGLSLNNFDIQLLLVKYKNNRDNSIGYFISITKEVKNVKQFLNFYRNNYTEKDFLKLFDEIIAWQEKREQKSKEKLLSIK